MQDYEPSSGQQKPRILVCAPSNGGVDVLAKRLLHERKSMGKAKTITAEYMMMYIFCYNMCITMG